jgi:transposase
MGTPRARSPTKVHRSTVPLWTDQWNQYGKEGLLEGHRSGRPAALSGAERERLRDILDSGPVAYGLETGIWTSPLVRQVIEEEFVQRYHAAHVRKLLRQLGYSCNVPPPGWCRPMSSNIANGCVTPTRV